MQAHQDAKEGALDDARKKKKFVYFLCVAAILFHVLFLTIVTISVILAFVVFKDK